MTCESSGEVSSVGKVLRSEGGNKAGICGEIEKG